MTTADASDLAGRCGELLNRHSAVGTFHEAATWREAASLLSTEWSAEAQARAVSIESARTQWADARSASVSRPLWKRLFKTQAEKGARASYVAIQAAHQQLEQRIQRIRQLIDFWPTNEAERKTRLQELRLEKRALTTDKKELGVNMRDVKTTARRRSVEAGHTIFADRKYVAIDRRNIASQREADLRPLEQQRQQIERAILELDRLIHHIERM